MVHVQKSVYEPYNIIFFQKSMVHVQKSVYEPYNIIFFQSLTTQNECQCVIV